ncbi:MAG: hypothetical protein MJZ32_06190 [Bacteroidaceae bacterium]|nr:hypothetical protein [Bacteroidaceae bacterium]
MAKTIKTADKAKEQEQAINGVSYGKEFAYLTTINEFKERADYYERLYKQEQKRLFHFIAFISNLANPIPDKATLLRTYFLTPTEIESEKIKHNIKS